MTESRRCSQRMMEVQTPIIPVISDLIRQYPDTLSLGQGVVYYAPPDTVFDAVSQAARRPELQSYGPVSGNPELIAAVKDKLQRDNQIDSPDSQEIIVTAGANMAFLNAILAIADLEDEIILLAPYYFNHEMAIRMLNCVPCIVQTDKQFQPCLDDIEAAINPKTRAIVTVSPNNPSGAVYTPTLLESINQLCEQYGLYHISDEAYEYFIYDDEQHYSPAQRPGSGTHTISLFSLSKSYGFAGWRIGYMVVPAHLYSAINKIQDTNLICAPQITQIAALQALKVGSEYCKGHLATLNERRTLTLQALTSIENGCDLIEPRGAFYFMIQLETKQSAFNIAKQLIEQYKIAVIPGSAFGLNHGCYLRIAYGALTTTEFKSALQRLVDGLGQIIRC